MSDRHGVAWILATGSLCVGLVAGLARHLADFGLPYYVSGDTAETEILTRHAIRGEHLVGPYSHLHWNQLGPAFFYLISPPYVLSGGNSRALALGFLLLSGGLVLAAVFVVRRLAGELAALVAVAVLAAYMVALHLPFLSDPWPANAVGLPLLLMMLLAAGAASGYTWAAWPILLLATIITQTYLAALPATTLVVGAASVLLAVELWRSRASPRRLPGPGGLIARAMVVVLALGAWIPPLVAQLTHSPQRVAVTYRFFTSYHPELGPYVSPATAVISVANAATVIPFGRDYGDAVVVHPQRLLAAGAGLLCALAAIGLGVARGRKVARNLGLVSILGAVATVVATTRIQGDLVNGFVLYFASTLLLPGLVGLGAALVPRNLPARHPAGAATRLSWLRVPVLVAGLVPGLLVAWSFAGAQPMTVGSSQDVEQAMSQIHPYVGPVGGRVIQVTTVDVGADPITEGIVLQLEKEGATVHISNGWNEKYSPPEYLTGGESLEILVALTGQPVQPGGTVGAKRLGVAGPVEVWARSLTL